MATIIQTETVSLKSSKLEVAQAKLHAAKLLAKDAAGFSRRAQADVARLLRAESDRLLIEVVELLASAVGLRVSAESVAKRQPSRKRARRKQTHGGSTISAPATAHPPKKNGLPVAKPWENPNLPDVNAST